MLDEFLKCMRCMYVCLSVTLCMCIQRREKLLLMDHQGIQCTFDSFRPQIVDNLVLCEF